MEKKHPNWDLVCKKFATNFLSVKSVVTLTMAFLMVVMVIGRIEPPKELLMLYSTAFGSIITYFFTKKEDEKND